LAFECENLLNYLFSINFGVVTDLLENKETVRVYFRYSQQLIKKQKIHDAINTLGIDHDYIDQLLMDPKLPDSLRIILWSLFWMISDFKDKKKLISFFREVSKFSIKVDAINYLFSKLRYHYPLFVLLIEKSLDSPKTFETQLEIYYPLIKDSTLFDEVSARIHELAVDLSIEEFEGFLIDLYTGHFEQIPQFKQLAHLLRASSSRNMSPLLITAYFSKTGRPISSQELSYLFSYIAKHRSRLEIRNLMWLIEERKWILDRKTTDQGLSLIRSLVKGNQIQLHIAIILFLKLLSGDDSVIKIMPEILQQVGKTNKNMKEYRRLPVSGERMVIRKYLKTLTKFSNENNLIGRGALIQLESIIDSALSSKRHNLHDRKWQETLPIRLNWKVIWPLIDGKDQMDRIMGINLLSFTDFPIKSETLKDDFIKLLIQTQYDTESSAWVNLLELGPIVEKKWESWKIVFESILSQPQLYSSEVLKSAIDCYSRIELPSGPQVLNDTLLGIA